MINWGKKRGGSLDHKKGPYGLEMKIMLSLIFDELLYQILDYLDDYKDLQEVNKYLYNIVKHIKYQCFNTGKTTTFKLDWL